MRGWFTCFVQRLTELGELAAANISAAAAAAAQCQAALASERGGVKTRIER